MEVVMFLAGEALKLFRRGSLLVVPAPLVGCTQTAVGWTDVLLLDNMIGGSVSICAKHVAVPDKKPRSREGDLGLMSIPFINGVSMNDLADVLDEMDEWAKPLRDSLLPMIADGHLKHERWGQIATIENDIRDALRFLTDRFKGISTTVGTGVATVGDGITAIGRSAFMPGHEPVTDVLRAIAPGQKDPAHWVVY